MLVRAATPPGSSGKVFGFVYSGLDLGACLTPLAFGWLLDHGDPRMLFVAVGILMLCTIATVVQVRRVTRSPPSARSRGSGLTLRHFLTLTVTRENVVM